MKHFALITGGAGGIGFSFAKICAQEGYQLLLVDIDENNLEKSKAELLEISGSYSVYTLQQDLSQENAAQEIF